MILILRNFLNHKKIMIKIKICIIYLKKIVFNLLYQIKYINDNDNIRNKKLQIIINKFINKKLKKNFTNLINRKNKFNLLKMKKIVNNIKLIEIKHIQKICMILIEFQILTEANRKTKAKKFSIFHKLKIYNLKAIQTPKSTILKLKSSLKWKIMVHRSKTWNLEKIVLQL